MKRAIDGEQMMEWQPIETAPKDGRPVWVRGNNYGQAVQGQHCCWAWWDGDGWKGADMTESEPSDLRYLVEWMPLLAAPVTPNVEANRTL